MKAYTPLSILQLGQPLANGDASPLVLLHGFTQTGRSWGPIVELLQDRFPIYLPDAPGHGGSSSVRAGLWETAELLAGCISGDRGNWCGYSMGARMALHVALAHPSGVERLVLISGTAGIDDEGHRRSRRYRDEELAGRIERDGKEGLQDFLSQWLAQPLFATLQPSQAGMEGRLQNDPAGLASSLRLAGAGAQDPLWGRLHELGERSLPVLCVAGELDRAYCAHAERMAALIGPSASVAVLKNAGHACHLEQPREVAKLIVEFCSAGKLPER